MVSNNIQLEERLVGQIKGEFYVPSYQRGYRWDKSQVTALLDDIYESEGNSYCLQPIVVRKDELGRFELIDGQQRLTTLYILYKYMKTVFPVVPIEYSLIYETRKENMEFFDNMDDQNLAETNIDFFFIHNAYQTIKEWFQQKGTTQTIVIVAKFLEYFTDIKEGKGVKIIWYELQSANQTDAISLFTRLNIGRIPLTNAELVKALFLCESEQVTKGKQMEIALQWDTIEREMHDQDFWYFLTKKKAESYATRIELLFDFMAGKDDGEREQFFTFLYFSKQRGNLLALWDDILRYYYRLKEWFKNDKLYHKIGYLVATGTSTIDVLMAETKELKKSVMDTLLDEKIRHSINCKKSYSELNYNNDPATITNILLLFNVISLQQNGSGARFPFKEFNNDSWSLEHIHAQHSLNLNTQEKWKEWLKLHIDSVRKMDGTEGLLGKMQEAINNERLTDVKFSELADRITTLFSEQGDTEYVHSISNMALLQCSKNSALSNALFDAKCRMIRDMDAHGQFIPYCTKMVFMKYYSSDKQNNISLNFWGQKDREAYVAKMNEVLKSYLKEPIGYGGE
ncbi:MAG: DUF262 domain-containing protein [Prevotella sp.]|nr:DUF262 domain-containing protein [Prevotella sp.]